MTVENRGLLRSTARLYAESTMKTLTCDPAILVVEDEYFLADDIARALTGAGASVLGPVPTAEEAVDLVDA
jgi:hypothetical protein